MENIKFRVGLVNEKKYVIDDYFLKHDGTLWLLKEGNLQQMKDKSYILDVSIEFEDGEGVKVHEFDIFEPLLQWTMSDKEWENTDELIPLSETMFKKLDKIPNDMYVLMWEPSEWFFYLQGNFTLTQLPIAALEQMKKVGNTNDNGNLLEEN